MEIPCITCMNYAICKTKTHLSCILLWETIYSQPWNEALHKNAENKLPNLKSISNPLDIAQKGTWSLQ